jgi:DNA-binding transcriptional LysR family regulator
MIFVLQDCPIANSYMPELNRLHESFQSRGIQLIVVETDPQITQQQAREHVEQFQIKLPVVIDTEHQWVKLAGAKKTPEAVVIAPTGEILYRGRIDDQYVGLGKRRMQVTSHDLETALEAILEGRPVPNARTEAIGCYIPEIKQVEPLINADGR